MSTARLISGVVVMALMVGASVGLSSHRTDTRLADINASRDHIFRTICGQNNIGKADTIWRVGQAKTAFGSPEAAARELARERRLQVILDCEATFRRGGAAVPLAPSQAERFVEIVGEGRVPLVKGGQVVGSRAAEAGRTADF